MNHTVNIALLLFIVSAIFLFSCQTAGEKKYEIDGFLFTPPQGWTVTEEEVAEGEAMFLTCERVGEGASGIFVLNVIFDADDLEYSINRYIDNLEFNPVYRAADIKFSPVEKTYFKGLEAVQTTFEILSGKETHDGRIICFVCNGNMVSLLFQQSVAEKAENREGFKLIENSISCSNR